MQLTIQKKEFLRGLSRTHAVADRKSSMAILSNVLLSTDGTKTLRFAATDLYLAVTATATAHVKSGGSIAVSARTLFEIVKSLPDGEVSFAVSGNHAAEVRAGKVRFKVPGMPGQAAAVWSGLRRLRLCRRHARLHSSRQVRQP